MITLPEAFVGLDKYAQFIIYKIGRDIKQPEKITKKPVHPITRIPHNPLDKGVWLSFNEASNLAKSKEFGIGFVLTKEDPFFLLDVDNDWDSINRNWSKTGEHVYTILKGAAFETSVSQKGFHIIGSCKSFPEHVNVAINPHNMQLYSHSRFIALTGLSAIGSVNFDCTESFKFLIQQYFPPKSNEIISIEWRDSPRNDWSGYDSDDELIEHALRSKPHFGAKATFKDLWENNISVLSQSYPPVGSGFYDASEADAALMSHLAFWTGCNPQRIHDLMWKSGLTRDKWETHKNYLTKSILKACQIQTKVHTKSKNKTLTAISPHSGIRPFLPIEQQIELFKGCVYVQQEHMALIPGGRLLSPAQFRAHFGGYLMPLDLSNEKITRNAWEAFTESQARFKQCADTTCFRPDLPPASIDEEEGERLVNTWWPVPVKRIKGDIAPILNHINRILPNERDRLIILSYMAACVQYPGIKFKWAPLLQGVEGNGKTLLTICVGHAIGWKYVQLTNAQKLAAKFNEWQYKKIFVGVDDIRIADFDQDTYEALKPMIDSERIEVEPKNLERRMRRICCNYFFTSNHKDAIRKTRNDRRFAVFYTAQQSEEDLIRDGLLDPHYFSELHHWLKNEQGHAYFNEFLATFSIPDEFNPTKLAIRAPKTSSTEEAISKSLTILEQEIMEAVQQELTGFKNGWISSIFLTKLFERIRPGRVPSYSKRYNILNTLEYIPHPALTEGRVNNSILPDGGKPRLFVQKGHYSLSLESATDVAKHYTEDQNGSNA